MTTHEFRFCPHCAGPLARTAQAEDGGMVERLRCAACGFTHWNNPTPVLAAVIEWRGGEGRVRIHGEMWHARGPAGLHPGEKVRVIRIHGLTLEVEACR